jgi:hypothetical protein
MSDELTRALDELAAATSAGEAGGAAPAPAASVPGGAPAPAAVDVPADVLAGLVDQLGVLALTWLAGPGGPAIGASFALQPRERALLADAIAKLPAARLSPGAALVATLGVLYAPRVLHAARERKRAAAPLAPKPAAPATSAPTPGTAANAVAPDRRTGAAAPARRDRAPARR